MFTFKTSRLVIFYWSFLLQLPRHPSSRVIYSYNRPRESHSSGCPDDRGGSVDLASHLAVITNKVSRRRRPSVRAHSATFTPPSLFSLNGPNKGRSSAHGGGPRSRRGLALWAGIKPDLIQMLLSAIQKGRWEALTQPGALNELLDFLLQLTILVINRLIG